MADADLKRELEELRRQVAALTERANDPTEGAPGSPDAGENEEPTRDRKQRARRDSGGLSAALQQLEGLSKDLPVDEVRQQLGNFLQGLGQDVRDSKPQALIAAFLAGVLAGKALSR